MYSLVVLTTPTASCNQSPLPISKTFSSPHTERQYPVSPPSLPCQVLVPSSLIFISRNLPVVSISSKWNRATVVLLRLAGFTQHHVFQACPCCSRCQNLIPFYGWVIVHCAASPCFVHLLMDICVVFTFWLLWTMLLWNWPTSVWVSRYFLFFHVYP